MTDIVCDHEFHLGVRKPDFPTYYAACYEFKQMHRDGAITGVFKVQFGDGQDDYHHVRVSVWRSMAVEVPGWARTLRPGADGTRYEYSRTFDPAAIRPDDIVAATKALLHAPPTH